ncbi:MAG: nucleoside deaminase [Lachnospiraceae bacterium]|nr:nucleoside deaminase [Lachnospiraceae bacterium]
MVKVMENYQEINYMEVALTEAYEGINNGHGGPFGSVVVKDGEIVGRGHNRVLLKKDPTCHGEMEAIRDACQKLGSHDLSGCVLYTTAEPCPMCLGAILWSNIATVYYGCNVDDTDKIGFRDDIFYRYLNGESDILELKEADREMCLKLFKDYSENQNNIRY